MRERLLILTIGVLVGVVVMQWAMPAGQATITTPPVGNVIAMAGDVCVTVSGEMWFWGNTNWFKLGDLPVPVSEASFFGRIGGGEAFMVDTSGNHWTFFSGTGWVNRGAPPGGAIPTSRSTVGGVKNEYRGKE